MAITSDNLKSKRGMVGGAVAALLVAGGVAAVVLPSSTNNSSDRGSATTGAEGAPVVLAQMGEPGMPGPVAPPGMGGPGAPTTGAPPAPAPKEKLPNSFSGAPPTYGGGGAPTTGGGFGSGGFGGGGFGGQTATTGTTADFSKLKPIARGKVAAGYRKDPFDSRRIPKYEEPPVYSFIAHNRMASRPLPLPPPPNPNPEIQFGPLPPVPRRVAGILYNGSVSAIIETGTPGAGAIVDVVSPGSTVPSGIPGVEDLTVVSIGATSVILRANDGRTVTVPLSAVPAAFADSFRNQNLPGGGTPGMGGPGMGAPPGMGGPGMMGPGGGRPGNFGPTGGGRPGSRGAPTDGD